MGLCRDFGSQISQGCNHLMRADSDSCHCDQCGVVCKGRFEACPSVWAQGPQPVTIVAAPAPELVPVPSRSETTNNTNGHVPPGAAGSASDDRSEVRTGDHPQDAGVAAAVPPPLPTSVAGTEVFRWFQGAFEALRLEVEGLRGALAQEQALVASLLERRDTDNHVDTESLAALVTTAVRKAVRREAAELATALAPTVEALRRDLDGVKASHDDHVAALQASAAAGAEAIDPAPLLASMAEVAADTAELRTSMAAVAADGAALKASSEALAAAGERLPAELNRRDAGARKAFRATLHEELQPLVEVVAESVAQSDYELKAIVRRLDQLTESEAALVADVAEVTAALAAQAGDDPAGNGTGAASEPEPEVAPAWSPLLDRRGRGEATTPPATATPSVRPRGIVRTASATPGPTPSGRPGTGPGAAVSRGTRVSLRRPPPEA